ncbi:MULTISPECIES: putidacin L1 family lectin-like bacteriocin [unclassified Pseudomonas]|uniref:putidacin L1 family lectin-like bacteriocin n=1 Tax=unclassified Pseudomonas TaxID=196821 RepID=UPI0008385D32|nr:MULTISPECIES: putidacin L1 family lectin-like bacteriocin [unclassified Pseudomonas]QIH09502.1 putidacin L1 family lectin-like bacteriocin [Pseudomonas sp. BIOMIG1BAC]
MAIPARIPFAQNGTSTLLPKREMTWNQYLDSPNKRFRLILQADSNLVLYDGQTAVWSAQANQPYTQYGNKVYENTPTSFYILYYAVLKDREHVRTWSTFNSTPPNRDETAAAERTYLRVQDDGNIVITDSISVWSSNPAIPQSPGAEDSIIIPPGTLERDKKYVAGGTTFIFQTDGNLVISNGPLGVLWASWTQNKGAERAVMQTDGNLVIYGPNNTPLWNSGTAGHPGAFLRVQANGNLSIVKEQPVWARFGYTPTLVPKNVFYFDNSTWTTKNFWTFPF